MLNRPWYKFYPANVPQEISAPAISIYEVLSQSTELHPDKIAVIDKDKDKDITYNELKIATERFAASLYANGFKKGDRLAIMLPNSIEYIIAFYAVQRLGGIVVQVNPMYQPSELDYILADSETKWFVSYQNQIPKLKQTEFYNQLIVIIADGDRTIENNLYKILENGNQHLPNVELDLENDIAILQYTGGTTGKPKGVMITHKNVISNLIQNKALSINNTEENPYERVMGIAPMFHAMGLTIMNTAIFRGGSFYIIRRFDLNLVVSSIRKFKPTIFSGSPTMYIALLNHPDLQADDLRSIKTFGSGSAPMSVELMNAFEAKTSSPISESYGLSEATTMTHKTPGVGIRKIGSIGIPVPSTDCRIVDKETGTIDVKLGEVGELIIKGPQVMKGYWKNDKETAIALRDGWLYTGDLAVMDEDGFFYIVGRKKDMIIAGGYNIYPMEIEEVIYKISAVKEVCVFGVPDPYRVETVKAAIVLKDNEQLSEEEIIAFCNEHLARYKVPRLIEFKDELPKTAVGKILRTQLIQMETDQLRKH